MAENMTVEKRIALFDEALGNIVSPEFRAWLIENGFFTAPASTKYHGCYEGGLFDHSFVVMTSLIELSAKNGLAWGRAESPFIIGMFHDLCKIDQYKKTDTQEMLAPKYEYVTTTDLKGHGDKSVIMLASHIQLTEEEAMCIRYHMGAFTEKEEWNDYTRAIHKFHNVLWTHHADMIASHVNNI